MSRFLVYALVDPRTLSVRYIGQSSTGMDRPREHACPSRLATKRTHTSTWIASLKKAGFGYSIAILETVGSADRLNDSETWWISFGRALGWDLTNHAPGGGTTRGLIRSAETRAKLSAARRGKTLSPEHRAAIGTSLTGRPVSEETKARLRARHLGRIMSPESRAKMSMAARLRHPQSDETRARKSVAGRGRKSGSPSEETRAKLSKALKGRPLSDVTRAQMSLSRRKPPRIQINLLRGR